jgi:hypothetical protein
MNRPFTDADGGQRFRYHHTEGTLEFPLDDPGSAEEGQGILWFDNQLTHEGAGWVYVSPRDVDRLCSCCGDVKPEGQSCGCFDNNSQ